MHEVNRMSLGTKLYMHDGHIVYVTSWVLIIASHFPRNLSWPGYYPVHHLYHNFLKYGRAT